MTEPVKSAELSAEQKSRLLEVMKSTWLFLKMKTNQDRQPIRAITHLHAESVAEDCAEVLSNRPPKHHTELTEAYNWAKLQTMDLWLTHGRVERRYTLGGYKDVFYFMSDLKPRYVLED